MDSSNNCTSPHEERFLNQYCKYIRVI
ncbi:unnamed protein product [Tetraodon nigroviridis]|uniref:Chromosome undetermined SCAF1667, whole genome shotgun sequence n=1 Tax=Tetraodon nigroviridis TaxID=99883 RepID=Q4TIV3_TETNG|nr:unnamed protein product [Tetraodon nigroviridis]